MSTATDDIRWIAAYHACREARGRACKCERGSSEPCPCMLMAACAVERVLCNPDKAISEHKARS